MPLVATKKRYLMAWAVLDLAKKKKHCVGEKETIDKISSSWWTYAESHNPSRIVTTAPSLAMDLVEC